MLILEENFKWHLEAFASELVNLFLCKCENKERNGILSLSLSKKYTIHCIYKRSILLFSTK